jgi:hypothetical protein
MADDAMASGEVSYQTEEGRGGRYGWVNCSSSSS